MTTPTHSHKPWTDKGGHVSSLELYALAALSARGSQSGAGSREAIRILY